MNVSNASVLIGAAIVLPALGVFVGFREAKRGDKSYIVELVLGLPGVYLSLVAGFERLPWLNVPALALIAAGAVGRVLSLRRAVRRRRDGQGAVTRAP